jgi:hypothetical protein
MKLPCANCAKAMVDRPWGTKIDMKKPNVHGPSPGRKADLALREKLNRRSKPAPAWPVLGEGGKGSQQNVRKSLYGKN